jgi:hypothetical protein
MNGKRRGGMKFKNQGHVMVIRFLVTWLKLGSDTYAVPSPLSSTPTTTLFISTRSVSHFPHLPRSWNEVEESSSLFLLLPTFLFTPSSSFIFPHTHAIVRGFYFGSSYSKVSSFYSHVKHSETLIQISLP